MTHLFVLLVLINGNLTITNDLTETRCRDLAGFTYNAYGLQQGADHEEMHVFARCYPQN